MYHVPQNLTRSCNELKETSPVTASRLRLLPNSKPWGAEMKSGKDKVVFANGCLCEHPEMKGQREIAIYDDGARMASWSLEYP